MNVVSANVMPSVLTQGRAEREKAADERSAARLRDAQAAVATLKQRNTAASDQKKASAKQRVDQIKSRLQMLRMSSPVDPKVLAQLARELKSAVGSYASAGGSVRDLGATTAPAATAPTDAATGDQAAVEVEVEAPQAEPAPQDAPAEASDGNPYQRVAQEAETRFADASRRNAATQADREFLSDVRNLANQIKAMAKQAAAQKADATHGRDGEAAEKAAAEALKAIDDAGQALNMGGVSLTV